MELKQTCCEAAASINVPSIGDFIAGIQKPSGEIPWSEGGRTDPWDHVESAMGLDTAGFHREADRAYGWLASQQLPDGSWYSATRDGVVEDATRDSNVASYVAVGLYHHFLITGDRDFLARHWAMLQAAINFAVSLQAATGEIHWAKNPAGVVDPMALLTGSSSVHMSLQCAARIARILGRPWQRWEAALGRLGEAICNRPNLFNMMKARFSMDWYYPILCGAVSGEQARQRVDRHWEKFVVPGWGVRCVSDQPWLTTAEGSELVMALAAIGENERAAIVLGWIADKKYGDGAYWMGVTFPDGVVWPDEKTSWTAAAILLAHDALYRITPAGRLFHHDFWEKAGNGAASGAPPERGRFADPGNRSSRLHRGGRDA